MEITHRMFEFANCIASRQAQNRLHTIPDELLATLENASMAAL